MRTNGTLNYLLGDHLGSTSLTTDASGQVVSELRYTAWGEVRHSSGNTATKYQYTGQYSYAGEFGLHFYNARWYDSSLGRFAQADSIIPGPGNPQAWDRYAYVFNNPLRYTDPTGHGVDCGIGMGCVSPYTPPSGPNSNSGNGGGSGGSSGGSSVGGDYCIVLPWLCGGSGGHSGGEGSGPGDVPGASENNYNNGDPGDDYCTYHPYACGGGLPTPSTSSSAETPPITSENGFTLPGDTALLGGALIFIAIAPVDVALIALPLVPGVGLAAHVLLLPLDLLALNVTLVSLEMMSEGSNNLEGEVTIDPLPLVHYVFPDVMNY